ncbi:MAG: ATP-binding protein [Chloroflexota bacterium]|nr:ATP-binding protein [Chloroflexota bacterium]
MPFPTPVSILVVDDQPRNSLALEAALASVDCSLVRAKSGRDALKCLFAQDFAVILLDIRMPVTDGFETAKLIRARNRSQSTPIMFMTPYDPDGAGMEEGYRLGGIDYIHKPFDPHILRSKVTFFVELFRKTVALEQMTADLVLREQHGVALNARLEERVIARTEALAVAYSDLEAAGEERLRTEEALRALEHTARAEAETAARQASVLAEVSRVLVENFMDHRPMLGRVAHIAAEATDAACVIQLFAEDGDEAGLVPLAVDHADQMVRSELARVLSVPHRFSDSPWPDLDRVFLDSYPLKDSLSVPMLARTALIGVLSLARFGCGALQFTDCDRKLSEDLAARVALAVENARLYENARTAIELRDKFLTIAAHELKTPLTTIQGYSQLLSHQLAEGLGGEAAGVRRSAQMIEDRTRHLAGLVEQILDVSRLVASRMQLDRDDTDVVGMIRSLVDGFESRDSSHEFRLHVRHERLQAAVDLPRMKQVMANLIDNAVRYSPQGGPIDISVGEEQDGTVVLSVRDRGLGIPEEHRAHIFDRFYQAHAVAYRSGMGLGLHISREIVLLHGGTITVAFPSDGGSHFTVRLPRTDHTPAGEHGT